MAIVVPASMPVPSPDTMAMAICDTSMIHLPHVRSATHFDERNPPPRLQEPMVTPMQGGAHS